jgi:hypothetical protein
MKRLIPYLVLATAGVTLAGPTRASETAQTSTDPITDPTVEWVLTISKEAAHRFEPHNPAPKPMPRELAKLIVQKAIDPTDRHELAMLVVYAFAEGAYSLDPELPGDCKDQDGVSLPPGTPKCTKKRLDAGLKCCSVEKASHFCTLQVEPKPANLEECVSRGASIMHQDIVKSCVHDAQSGCCDHPGSIYATGGSCVYNPRIDWRARIAKHLEEMP